MSKKSGGLFEQHVVKFVFGIVGLVSIWLLLTCFVSSPNKVIYNGKKLSPGQIDTYVLEHARHLEQKLRRPPEIHEPYKPKINEFVAKMDSAIGEIDAGVYVPAPPYKEGQVIDDRKYALPKVGEIDDIEAGHIRAVVYMPTEEISEQKKYGQIETEPNDLDLVTVTARFDVWRLYENFYESFAGSAVEESWRDPCLAKPIFAAVELQRQKQLKDGSWSQWQRLQRSSIDPYKSTFKIIEKLDELPPGGMKVRLLQFDSPAVRAALLQPAAYEIASAEEEWFPPSLYKKYKERIKEMKLLERRQAREQQKQERDRARDEARAERARRMAERARTSASSDVLDDSTAMADESRTTATTRTTRMSRLERLKEREADSERPEQKSEQTRTISTNDIYNEFNKIRITGNTDFSKMRQPLMFWAFDDTARPGESYRYRIRLGVFNPLAGTERIEQRYEHLRENVILWSEFSDVSNIVEIPEILYLFATKAQESTKKVEVTVCRYSLGYWYTKAFWVSPGELIGKVIKYEPSETEQGITLPEQIDYSTGAILVDLVEVNDWFLGRGLRQRRYLDMVYGFGQNKLLHMPVGIRFWANDVQFKFNEIKKLEKMSKKPWRDFGTRTGPSEKDMQGAEGEYMEPDVFY